MARPCWRRRTEIVIVFQNPVLSNGSHALCNVMLQAEANKLEQRLGRAPPGACWRRGLAGFEDNIRTSFQRHAPAVLDLPALIHDHAPSS